MQEKRTKDVSFLNTLYFNICNGIRATKQDAPLPQRAQRVRRA